MGEERPAEIRAAWQVMAATAVGAIPLVGPVLWQLIEGTQNERKLQRLERFAREFDQRVNAVMADNVDSDYAHSEAYVSYVMHAAEIAASSHREAKIVLLAEVAAGALRAGTSDIWRDKFLSAVELLLPEHVEVLRAMAGGEHWLALPEGMERPLLEETTGLARDVLELILRDLASLGFVADSGTGRISVTSGQAWRPTLVGDKFLEFLVSKAHTESAD